jgi:hypothetical protein
MGILLGWWKNHGTKILGFAQGTIAAVAGVSDVIPPGHLKYYLAASALLTFWRGFANTGNQSGPTP